MLPTFVLWAVQDDLSCRVGTIHPIPLKGQGQGHKRTCKPNSFVHVGAIAWMACDFFVLPGERGESGEERVCITPFLHTDN